MRAHFYRPVQDGEGDLQPDITVTVYEGGSLDLLALPIYVDDSSSSERTNPFVASSGVIDFFLDQPRRIKIGIKRALEEEQFYDNVDVLPAPVPGQVVVSSPNGALWAVKVDDSGTLFTEAL